MDRNQFLKTILGTSMLISMDGLSALAHALAKDKQPADTVPFATFGAVHLNNTSLKKSAQFWTKIVGLKQRRSAEGVAEFGTEHTTLVVVHETSKTGFVEGYSGLYHFAIHAPSKGDFAKMLYRLMAQNYPCTPTDHTMSQSVYLNDPDGITVEFALETPERFKRVITEGGLRMEDADGNIRSASSQLDVEEVLKALPDKDLNKAISEDTRIGHIHFYANNVEKSDSFYKQLGFVEFNYLPQFLYADVGAGGAYKHRVAMNSWHGMNKPLAPQDSAGLRHFQILFDSKERLSQALKNVYLYEEKDGSFWVKDPTGNLISLAYLH